MIPLIVMGAVLAGLIVLYLISPHYLRFYISSARFFRASPDGPVDTPRFRWRSLALSRSFWLQLSVLTLLLLALLFTHLELSAGQQSPHVGVWLAIDASSSITTIQAGIPRAELAYREVEALREQLNRLADEGISVCVVLSTFDLAEQVVGPVNLAELRDVESYLQDFTLGTDLGLIRGRLARLADVDTDPGATVAEDKCRITHLVVVTDRPVPEWAAAPESNTPAVIWRDVGEVVDNVGIVDVSRAGSILATSDIIEVTVAAYGQIPVRSTVTLRASNGAIVRDETIDWEQRSPQRVQFESVAGGQHTVSVRSDDAYMLDNAVTITFQAATNIHVDWQIEDHRLVSALGWVVDSRQPHLRVTRYPYDLQDDDVPTLLVGPGYSQPSLAGEPVDQIAYFAENQLLADLNFDVAERLGLPGVVLQDDDGLQSIMFDESGQTWFAVSFDPPAVLVPGEPVGHADASVNAFSRTAFFNAVDWLLQAYTPPPLYSLTSPENPLIAGDRNALHPGEGETPQPQSNGEIADISPAGESAETFPLWPLLLLGAMSLLTLERGAMMFGGARWK